MLIWTDVLDFVMSGWFVSHQITYVFIQMFLFTSYMSLSFLWWPADCWLVLYKMLSWSFGCLYVLFNCCKIYQCEPLQGVITFLYVSTECHRVKTVMWTSATVFVYQRERRAIWSFAAIVGITCLAWFMACGWNVWCFFF